MSRQDQHDRLYLRLKVLFAGYEPASDQYQTTVDYLIDHILFKAYKFVIELRQLLKGYQKLKDEEQRTKKLANLLQKIQQQDYRTDNHGVTMSIFEINSLMGQVKVVSPYRGRIHQAQHGVFNNLEYFMDIANGIRKVHLQKANQLLPNVFSNLINRSSIQGLLQQDLQETQANYQQIEEEVKRRINAVSRMHTFYNNFFNRFQQKLEQM